MPAQLIDLSDGRVIPLHVSTLIGRASDAQVHVPDNRVSRQHAMIREQGGDDYWFYDLGSVNGSCLNGRRVVTGQQLRKGDVIRLVDAEFRFECDEPAAGRCEDGGDASTTHPELRSLPVIVLVADVRGYTSLSERLAPEQLAQIIGSWYRECTRIIEEQGGIVDKFIGDAVLAYWTDASPAFRDKATHVPALIREACAEISRRHAVFIAPAALECGYALHVGPVVLGHLGAGAYTLVGDTVNVAFRLQALTRTLDEMFLVSGEFIEGWSAVGVDLHALGSRMVKGHAGALDVHAVLMA